MFLLFFFAGVPVSLIFRFRYPRYPSEGLSPIAPSETKRTKKDFAHIRQKQYLCTLKTTEQANSRIKKWRQTIITNLIINP